MRKIRNKFKKPKKPYDKNRISNEKLLLREYGLRRKKEIYVAEEILRNFRRRARELIAVKNEEKEKILLEKLSKLGIVPNNSNLDNVLALTIKDILNRRLQTIVFKRGLTKTVKEARQLIVHKHIEIDGKKMNIPSCLIKKEDENKIKII